MKGAGATILPNGTEIKQNFETAGLPNNTA
jgi:hypothetical protein